MPVGFDRQAVGRLADDPDGEPRSRHHLTVGEGFEQVAAEGHPAE